MDEEIREKVQTLIENAINPAIAGHGGFVDDQEPAGGWSNRLPSHRVGTPHGGQQPGE